MSSAVELCRDVGVIVAAAGSSQRYGVGRNKLLELLEGVPVFAYCLRVAASVIVPDRIVLVAPRIAAASFRRAMTSQGLPPSIRVVCGGATRQESVLNGLMALPEDVEFAAVHDAARPFLRAALLTACIDSARRCGSGVAARRVTDTVKVADAHARVESTLDRDRLWAAETPQVFRYRELLDAFREAARANAVLTDEAQAMELAGRPVHLVEHAGRNDKITHPGDLHGPLPGG